jgi:hypothetical protein
VAKSSIFFSPNTNVDVKVDICTALNINTEAISDKYLGLPAIVGVDRSDCFLHLVERVLQRIKGWKEKMLSIGGKEILIKAVIQSIPAYAMSVFLLPKNICKKITNIIAQFWWGDDDKGKKMHWYAWWKMCFPKREGGLGFRDFHSFNLAMLAKQVSRIIDDPDSLCAKVLRAKYFPDGDILRAGPKAGSSFTWQSIVAGIQTFKKGCIWRLGSGESIHIWRDPWIPTSPNRRIISPRGNCILTKVSELIDPYTGQWDLLHNNFHQIDVNRIIQIPLVIDGFDDFLAWHGTRTGRFSVRSAYHTEWRHAFNGVTCRSLIAGTPLNNIIWKILWKLDVSAKVKIYCWRILHGVLPLKAILFRRHIGDNGLCPVCNTADEDVLHMIFKCSEAENIWKGLGLFDMVQRAIVQGRSGSETLGALLSSNQGEVVGFESLNHRELVAVAA